MIIFLERAFSSIVLIFATLINSIVPMLISNPLTDDAYYDAWSSNDTYQIDSDRVLEKDPDEDFKVLILTDIQNKSGEALSTERFETEAMIEALYEQTNPDMIALVGDNAIGMFSYEWLVNYLDSFDIPWAGVMGNHDGQNIPGESWAAYKMMTASNSLFKFGPEDMGHGNYAVHISQNNKIIHSLYFMDTHDVVSFYNGTEYIEDEYDGLWKNQIEWYKWNVNGLNTLTNSNVESSLFIHIPLPEYRDAREAMASDPTAFGEQNEWICASAINNGMFDVIKDLGSTKNVIAGHDHRNNFSTTYQGIRLSYATKTGTGSYHDENMLGGSLLTIDANGAATFSSIVF